MGLDGLQQADTSVRRRLIVKRNTDDDSPQCFKLAHNSLKQVLVICFIQYSCIVTRNNIPAEATLVRNNANANDLAVPDVFPTVNLNANSAARQQRFHVPKVLLVFSDDRLPHVRICDSGRAFQNLSEIVAV